MINYRISTIKKSEIWALKSANSQTFSWKNVYDPLHTSAHWIGANTLPSRFVKITFCGFQTKNEIVQGGELEVPSKIIFHPEPPLFISNSSIIIWYILHWKSFTFYTHKWDLEFQWTWRSLYSKKLWTVKYWRQFSEHSCAMDHM